MRKSLLFTAVMGALLSQTVYAEEAAAPAAAPASPWTLTSNISFVSNYYARGVSQSWNMPAVQGGFDITHSSGFYAGAWGSSISERTYVGASTEFDLYGGYNGTIAAVDGLGYTVGVIGYFYPGGGWDKYDALTDSVANGGKKTREDFTTYEANVGLSYKWFSTKASFTLGEWFGANKDTGWSKSSSGTYYIEANANVPLPVWDLTLVAHVGRLDVAGELSLDPDFANANGADIVERKADMTDWKLGLNKAFTIAGSSGWNAGLYYVGGTNGGNSGYWGTRGYGGSSFTTKPGSKDLTDDTLILTLGRTF